MVLLHRIVLFALPQATQGTAAAHERITGGDAFLLTVNALGLIVLAAIVVRRLGRPDKLLLINTPPRHNHMGLIHIVALLLAQQLLGGLLVLATGLLLHQPVEHGGEPQAQTLILGGILVNLATLAVVLAVGQAVFVRGLQHGLGFTGRHWICDSLRGGAAALAVFPICTGLAWVSSKIVPITHQHLHPLLQFVESEHHQPAWLCLGFLLAVGIAPVVEEAFFRGMIQSALRRWLGGPWRAIFLTSLIFALVHVDWSRLRGFEVVPPLLALSITLGYNYERTGRLLPNMVTHALFNAVNIIGAAWGTST
jgi:membrane protease YdiL (CAAX protease family)